MLIKDAAFTRFKDPKREEEVCAEDCHVFHAERGEARGGKEEGKREERSFASYFDTDIVQ